MKKTIIFLISMIIMICLIAGCQFNKTKHSKSFFGSFDTIVTITAYETDKEFEKMMDIAEETMSKYSRYFDRYSNFDGINNIKTINDNAGIAPVKVDQEIIDLLDYSIEKTKILDGKINIVFGAVLEIWHEYREDALNNDIVAIPSIKELNEANKHVNIDSLKIDHENSTVFLEDEEMSLDLGAIAKGYSVELLADRLKKEGYDSFLINAGGNVKAVGMPSDTKADWVVGIQDPNSNGGSVSDIVKGNNISIVTSGVYQRYYEYEGERYHHIIDTTTLFPANIYKSVSIISEDSGLGDILSTGVFLKPVDEALSLINSIDGVEAIFITNDDSKYYSDGMGRYLDE